MAERYMAHSMATYTGDPAAMCLMTRRSTHNKSIGTSSLAYKSSGIAHIRSMYTQDQCSRNTYL